MSRTGRPTKYNDEIQAKAEQYVSGYAEAGDTVPTIAGLACELGIHKDTCYEWAKIHDSFSDVFTRVGMLQERALVNGGLSGDFNPAVTKMLLTKHGYSDKMEQAHTSPDGSMSPTRIEIVSPSDENGSD